MKLALEASLPYRILTLLVLAVFYGIYLVEQWVQKRRRIQSISGGVALDGCDGGTTRSKAPAAL